MLEFNKHWDCIRVNKSLDNICIGYIRRTNTFGTKYIFYPVPNVDLDRYDLTVIAEFMSTIED